MKKFLLLLITLLSLQTYSQDYPKSNDFTISPRYIDIDSIKIDININPYDDLVQGKTSISFEKLRSEIDSFFIHGVNFKLKSLKINNSVSRYKQINAGFWIYPDKLKSKNNLEIEYSAHPKKGMYFIGWNTEERNNQIWTQGQGIDNRHWFPSYDLQHEKSIFDIKIGFPKGYNILSNGKLLEKIESDSLVKWHYQTLHPMSSYLVMIAGGDYNYETVSKTIANKIIDFQYWHYPERKDWNNATYFKTEDIMEFLSEEIGNEFPWAKYAQIPVSDFKHGAMENTGATVFSQTYNCNDSSFVDANYLDVNAHEMAHQWFGNSLTAESSKHHWLQEGFATYFQLKAIEKFLGEDEFIWEKRNRLDEIFIASENNPLPVLHPKAGTEKFYHKGAFILMMLDKQMGHENFKKALKNYVDKYKFEVVRTEQLIRSFEESSGMVLEPYFNQWLNNKVEAKVNVKQSKVDSQNLLIFERKNEIWEDSTKTFELKIPIVLHLKKQAPRTLIFNLNKQIDTLVFSDELIAFEIDPKIECLADIKVYKNEELWKNQLENSSSSYSRYTTLKSLVKLDEKSKIKLYSKFDVDKENHMVLYETFNQIDTLKSKKAQKLRNKILEKNNIDLRKNIVMFTDTIRVEDKNLFEDFLNTKSYDLIASSLDKLCLSFPDEADIYLKRFENTKGAQVPIVRFSYLANSILYSNKLSDIAKEELGDELVSYTSNKYDFLTRIYATYYVFNSQYIDYMFLRNMIDGAVHFNHQLTSHCREIISLLNQYEVFHKEFERIKKEDKLSESELKYLDQLLNDNS